MTSSLSNASSSPSAQSESKVCYWDPKLKKLCEEAVYGEAAMRWLYEKPAGKLFCSLLAKRFCSWLVGCYQSSSLSRRRIPSFIEEFSINMDDFVEQEYASFNEFFARALKPGKRPFSDKASDFCAPCDARYLVYDKLEPSTRLPVKGEHLTAEALLGSREKALPFIGGPVLIARLCPTDYHRYHYPDDGSTTDSYSLHGPLHSVNPVALAARSDVFVTNERQVNLLESKNFGPLAYIEVGAMNVGKMVQTHNANEPFERGQEKGYFLFGASTVIVLGQAGRFSFSPELHEQSANGVESLIQLGEVIGQAESKSS